MTTLKPSLFALAEVRQSVINKIIEQDGEITPEDDLSLAASEMQIVEKLEAYDAVLRRLESEADRAKEYAGQVSAYGKACERAVENVRGRMLIGLKVSGIEKQKLTDGTSIGIQAPKPSVTITNLSLIPGDLADYEVTETIKPRKAEILKAIQDGREVPGAHLEPGYEGIRITKPRAKSIKDNKENQGE